MSFSKHSLRRSNRRKNQNKKKSRLVLGLTGTLGSRSRRGDSNSWRDSLPFLHAGTAGSAPHPLLGPDSPSRPSSPQLRVRKSLTPALTPQATSLTTKTYGNRFVAYPVFVR